MFRQLLAPGRRRQLMSSSGHVMQGPQPQSVLRHCSARSPLHRAMPRQDAEAAVTETLFWGKIGYNCTCFCCRMRFVTFFPVPRLPFQNPQHLAPLPDGGPLRRLREKLAAPAEANQEQNVEAVQNCGP